MYDTILLFTLMRDNTHWDTHIDRIYMKTETTQPRPTRQQLLKTRDLSDFLQEPLNSVLFKIHSDRERVFVCF